MIDNTFRSGMFRRKRRPKVVILITNKPGELSDALRNRTFNIQLTNYTNEELLYLFVQNTGFRPEDIDLVLRATRNPRIIALLGREMGVHGIQKVEEFLKFAKYKKIGDWYLSPHEQVYLEALKERGRASESLLLVETGFDRRYLHEIERDLLKKGLIDITPRGRVLANSPQGGGSLASIVRKRINKEKQNG